MVNQARVTRFARLQEAAALDAAGDNLTEAETIALVEAVAELTPGRLVLPVSVVTELISHHLDTPLLD